MIHEETCWCASCDNCGEIFNDGEYSLFPLESDVKDRLRNDGDWYAGETDPDHIGKHYCPDCFKQDEDVDDKIILDTTRTASSLQPKEAEHPVVSDEGLMEMAENYVNDVWKLNPPFERSFVQAGYIAGAKAMLENDKDDSPTMPLFDLAVGDDFAIIASTEFD